MYTHRSTYKVTMKLDKDCKKSEPCDYTSKNGKDISPT